MKVFQLTQKLEQFNTRMGTYYLLEIPGSIVATFSKKQRSRVQITLQNERTISCALKPNSSGNFYVYLSKGERKKLKLQYGDEISFSIEEHPHPLGVDLPEVLTVFLEQDPEARAIYETFTDGKKRTLVFSILRIKDIDKQIDRIRQFITDELYKQKGIKND